MKCDCLGGPEPELTAAHITKGQLDTWKRQQGRVKTEEGEEERKQEEGSYTNRLQKK